ncbi:MAG: hypothetical protein PHV23_00820 [Candidatus Gracilibacteria bacterium]|nr:hypothetical protein [Candidatus Gracilibacteria bacterium]
MGLFDQMKESREAQRVLNLKKDLFDRYANGILNKAQYELELERLNLTLEQEKINKSKPTVGGVAIRLASSMVKGTVNGIFWAAGTNVKPFKKK